MKQNVSFCLNFKTTVPMSRPPYPYTAKLRLTPNDRRKPQQLAIHALSATERASFTPRYGIFCTTKRHKRQNIEHQYITPRKLLRQPGHTNTPIDTNPRVCLYIIIGVASNMYVFSQKSASLHAVCAHKLLTWVKKCNFSVKKASQVLHGT